MAPRREGQAVSGAGCGEGEHEVSCGRQRAQSPLSGNLAGEGSGARGEALQGEVVGREGLCVFVFRRQETEMCLSLRKESLGKGEKLENQGEERNEEKL